MKLPHLTIAYWCVFVAVLLPYVCTWLAKLGGRAQMGGKFDNQQPRLWLSKLKGWPARANAAQANSFEALPFFIGAVILAHQMKALQGTLDMLCVLFVVLRVLYILVYLANVSGLRSFVWFLAFLINVGIFFSGY